MNISPERLFSALGNVTRLRCLCLIARNAEVCVCEIVDALGISQPTASKALAALKAVGILCDRRDANWIYYSLSGERPQWVSTVIEATLAQLETEPYLADQTRFEALNLRSTDVTCA